MSTQEEDAVREIVGLLKENELAMGLYYAVCAARFPKLRNKWLYLQAQEDEHALALGKIEADLKDHPYRWHRGKVMPETIRFMTVELRKKANEVRCGDMDLRYAVTYAIDVESSLLEKELLAAVKTDNVEFQNLLAQLWSETEDHRQRLLTIIPSPPAA